MGINLLAVYFGLSSESDRLNRELVELESRRRKTAAVKKDIEFTRQRIRKISEPIDRLEGVLFPGLGDF